MKTTAKIKKLIENSLFLDADRKLKLLELIKNSGTHEDEILLKNLQSEEAYFSELIKSFIQRDGQSAVDYLNQGFSKIAGISNAVQEKHDRKGEQHSLEDLIKQINAQN